MMDEWGQLGAKLGDAAILHLNSNDGGRGAAIIQLEAVLTFLHAKNPRIPTTPLHILLSALRDLQDAKPARILEPSKADSRPRDDVVLRKVKVMSAVIMDQLFKYAELSRQDAAKAVARTFADFGLSDLRGKKITATTIEKWRDSVNKSEEFKRYFAMDAKALTGDESLERKRAFLLNRLSVFLISFGEARGQKADKTRQRLASDIQRRNPQ